jgi:hypothetical protein
VIPLTDEIEMAGVTAACCVYHIERVDGLKRAIKRLKNTTNGFV